MDGKTFTGNTDDEGKLGWRTAGNLHDAVLVVGKEPEIRQYRIALGGVDPLDCIRGVQQRLINLKYGEVSVTGELDEATRWALACFQGASALPQTGEDDEQTRARLRERHGH